MKLNQIETKLVAKGYTIDANCQGNHTCGVWCHVLVGAPDDIALAYADVLQRIWQIYHRCCEETPYMHKGLDDAKQRLVALLSK